MDIYVFRAYGGTKNQSFKADIFFGTSAESVHASLIGDFSKKLRTYVWRFREEHPSEAIWVHQCPPAALAWFPGTEMPESYGEPMTENEQLIFTQIFSRSKSEAERLKQAFEHKS